MEGRSRIVAFLKERARVDPVFEVRHTATIELLRGWGEDSAMLPRPLDRRRVRRFSLFG